MTVATLIVRLTGEVSDFHNKLEDAARHMEMIGRRIARAGMEITKAVAPFAAIVAGGLAAAVAKSALIHGELWQAWERLRLESQLLLREIGGALTPAFERMAQAKGGLIEKARELVAWFEHLSPSTQNLIIKIGLFIAAIGPAIFFVGSMIRAVGALWSVLTMLSSVIWTVVSAVAAFLVENLAMIAAIGLLVVAGALLIRHWQQVKNEGSYVWNGLKIIVFDAVDMILNAFQRLAAAAGLDGMMDKIADARSQLAVLQRQAEAGVAAATALMNAYNKPLLPDWIRNLPTTLKNLFSGFTLPALPPLPSQSFLEASDTLDRLSTALSDVDIKARLFGTDFDANAARAQAYKTAIDELIGKHIALDAALNMNGLTIKRLAEQFKKFADDVHLALGPYVAQSLQAFAKVLGDVVSGATHSLKGFGGALLGVIGSTMISLGGALVALGTAKLAALSLDPFEAIGIGLATIAFGEALSNAASAIGTPGGSGGGGGGGAAPASGASSSSTSQGDGKIILELHGDGVVGALFSDPRNQDALAAALRALAGRDVQVVPVMG